MWHQVHHLLAFIGKKLLRTSSGKWCQFPFLPKWFAGTKPLSILHFDSISEKAAGHRQAVFSWRKCIQRKQRTLETRYINLINLVALPTSAQWGPLAVVSWNPSLPKTRKDSDATNTLHGVSCTWQWQHQWPLQVQIYFSLQGILVDFGFTDQSDGGNRVEILKDSTSKCSHFAVLNHSQLE